MTKKKGEVSSMPDKEQQLRWQAEDIVRQSIQNTPSYKQKK
uniref:Uncharacterized protein n=1 Tax=viral metagenome TaxID=1070528 RepID=A0A6M3KLB8_9ZZZZ